MRFERRGERLLRELGIIKNSLLYRGNRCEYKIINDREQPSTWAGRVIRFIRSREFIEDAYLDFIQMELAQRHE